MNETTNSGEMIRYKVDYKPSKDTSKMDSVVLVSEQDIIATYSEEEQQSCRQYAEYQDLVKGNPAIGYKCCAKLLGVSYGRTRWWHTKGAKKAVPLALKTVETLKKAGLISFTEGHEHAKIIFNILGTLFGDGGIDKRLNTMAFISSDKRDVDLWEEDLLNVFPFAKGKTNLVEGGEWGHSYNIRTFDRNIIRFFVALGAPVGNKVTTKYSLPKSIFGASAEIKKAFLDGLLASEVSVVQWKPDPRNNNFRFQNFSVGLSKIEQLENEHRQYLQSVESLLESVGIATTKNINKNNSAGNQRKDGLITANYRIFIRTTFDRVLFFNDTFQLRYATAKKERFEKVIRTGTCQKNGWQNPDDYK